MRIRQFILQVALSAISACAWGAGHQQASAIPPRPKLVVGIVVDQLRTDYLEYLTPLMGQDGFGALSRQGTYMRDVRYDPARLDAVSSTAMLMTGATPDRNGVPSARTWDSAKMMLSPTLSDPDFIGNFTSETYSPRALRLSTVTDEVMIDGAGLGQAWSVAADPQQAVTLAGHSGTGALWLDRNSGKWCTSTYYKEMPQVASDRNYRLSLSSRLDTMQWKPMLPLESYPGLPAQKRYYPFRYTFPTRNKDVYDQFAASPKANTEVTDLALDLLRSLKLGNRGDAIDMLCVSYSLAPFKYVKDGDYRLELMDAYLRLDRDIARLAAAVDKAAGPGGALVFLVSTGHYDDATIDDEKYRIPSGTFSVKRAVSLLNAFLTARHGQGNYVGAYADGAVYLNRQLLEQKGLATDLVAREAKEFLVKMSGVEAVYTMSDLLSASSPEEESLRLCVDPKGGADLLIEICPGWLVSDDTVYPVQTHPVRHGRYMAPAMVMGPGIPRGKTVETAVPATAIAPTLSSALRIRQPNGSRSLPAL